jgi:hypothetical protein
MRADGVHRRRRRQGGRLGRAVFAINPAATRTDRIISLTKARKASLGDESRWQEALTNCLEPPGRSRRDRGRGRVRPPACGYVSGATSMSTAGGAFRS